MAADRIVARKCLISDLLSGRYVVKEGAELNYIETPLGNVSGVNLVAAVVGKQGTNALLLDDGTGRIEARAFTSDGLFEALGAGDIVLLIGRVREHDGQRYIVAEIAKRLGSHKWLELRRAELELGAQGLKPSAAQVVTQPEVTKEKKPVQEVKKTPARETPPAPKKREADLMSAADKVLALIRKLDDGQGAPIEKVVAASGSASTDAVLRNLMAEGEIFELRPGRVKVLE
jgi:hypothetical protein